jgi:hypothetical protein
MCSDGFTNLAASLRKRSDPKNWDGCYGSVQKSSLIMVLRPLAWHRLTAFSIASFTSSLSPSRASLLSLMPSGSNCLTFDSTTSSSLAKASQRNEPRGRYIVLLSRNSGRSIRYCSDHPCHSIYFQLPLSGSHPQAVDATVDSILALSTPSLGITLASVKPGVVKSLTTFQLPLSGSHSRRKWNTREQSRFQLPLSGSRDALRGEIEALRQQIAFNSLSRDHFLKDSMSPSLRSFQLPLSGSPSPIPGFFGFPRRFAAAPLRTNGF